VTRRESVMAVLLAAALAVGAAATEAAVPPAGAVLKLSPPRDQVVQPGESIDLVLEVVKGGPITGATFLIRDRAEHVEGDAPLKLTIQVPADLAGILPIEVEATGPDGVISKVSSRLIVRPTEPYLSIATLERAISLSAGDKGQIVVLGRTRGGLELAIQEKEAGTEYSVGKEGKSVLSVSPDGAIEARAAGRATVTIRNGGLSADVEVEVRPVNHPPKIEPLEAVEMKAGENRVLAIDAKDPDGNGVRFSTGPLPAWVRLTDAGGGRAYVELRPGAGESGRFSILVTATDNGVPVMLDSARLAITVTLPGK